MFDNLKPIHCYFIIAIAGLILFFNTLENEFVFDDESVVQNNLSIQTLSTIPDYFTAEDGFHKVIGRYYRPIVSTTYNIDYALWELDPWGFHLTNVLIHIIACLILFALLQELFKGKKYGLIGSLIGTLVFLVHPVHTEAVSWVSGRTDSMVTIFFFASFLFYVRYYKARESKKQADREDAGRMLVWALILYFIGLLSKEMIITMPVILILFDFLFRGKSFAYLKNNMKAYGWFFAVTGFYLLLRTWLLSDIPERESYLYFKDMDFVTVIATMVKTIPVYFKLLFAPVGLLYHYNGFLSDARTFADGAVIGSIIFVLALIGVAVFAYRKNLGPVAFCIIFFFISLAPVMNIVPTMSLMAERFLYMTSFALSLMIVYLIVNYITKKNQNAILGASAIVIIIFSILTFQRNTDWKDNNTLYSTADGVDGTVLLVNVGNIYANAGSHLWQTGQQQQANIQFEEAIKRFRKAISIRDNSILAHHNMGLIHMIRGQLDSAIVEINKGLALDPLAPDGYFQLAQIYRVQNNPDDAIKYLEKLQEISPNYRNSATMLEELKMMNIGKNNGSLTGQPNFNSDAQRTSLEQRSFDMYNAGDYKGSIALLTQLIELAPGHRTGYYNNIGLCYEELGEFDKAKFFYEKAIAEDPKNLVAYGGLGSVALKTGNRAEAIRYYELILKETPDDMIVKNKLDSIKALK